MLQLAEHMPMNIINISVKKSEVLEEVTINTSYMGSKSVTEDDSASRIPTTVQDVNILTRLWNRLCCCVTDKLKGFISDYSQSDETLSLTLEMSTAFDESLLPSVKTDLILCMAAGITAGWCRFVEPAKETEWQKMSDHLLDHAFNALCLRKKPLRPR